MREHAQQLKFRVVGYKAVLGKVEHAPSTQRDFQVSLSVMRAAGRTEAVPVPVAQHLLVQLMGARTRS
jgi:hypothetical protein